jgi:hypothetical protein
MIEQFSLRGQWIGSGALRRAIGLACVVVGSGVSWAQPTGRPGPQPAATGVPDIVNRQSDAERERRGGLQSELSLRGDLTLRSDLSEGGGDVAVRRAGYDVNLTYAFSRQVIGSLTLGSDWAWYDFEGAGGLIAGTGKPWGQLSQSSISPRVIIVQDQTWSYLVGGSLTAAGESDADLGDSLRWSALGALRYQASESLGLTFGVVAASRLERATQFVPLIGLTWRIDDKTTLDVGGRGLGVELRTKLEDAWTLSLSAGFDNAEYRLNDEAPLAEGIVRDQRVPLLVGVTWSPASSVEVGVRVGAVVYQEFTVYDRRGDELSETNTDPAAMIGLSASLKF